MGERSSGALAFVSAVVCSKWYLGLLVAALLWAVGNCAVV
jgi:hypothetical protein